MTAPWTTSASASLRVDGGLTTLVEGPAFAISLSSGDMVPDAPHGVFFRDTRILTELRLRVNGHWPEPLAATTLDPFSASFVLRDQPAAGEADSHLMIFRNRWIGRGMREDLAVYNYGTAPARSIDSTASPRPASACSPCWRSTVTASNPALARMVAAATPGNVTQALNATSPAARRRRTRSDTRASYPREPRRRAPCPAILGQGPATRRQGTARAAFARRRTIAWKVRSSGP